MARTIGQAQMHTHFHRGRLAGLSPEARAAALQGDCHCRFRSQRERLIRMASRRSPYTSSGYGNHRGLLSAITSAAAGSTLEEALSGSTVETIRQALKDACPKRRSCGKKALLVKRASDGLPQAVEHMERLLRNTRPASLSLLLRTAHGEQVELDPLGPTGDTSSPDEALSGAFPYVFASKGIAFMPPELQEAFSSIDIDSIVSWRTIRDYTVELLHAAVILCGAASVHSLYEHYRCHGPEPAADEGEFIAVVEELCEWNPLMRLCTVDGAPCVTSTRISDCSTGAYDDGEDCWDRWDRSAKLHMQTILTCQHAGIASPIEAGRLDDTNVSAYIYNLPCVQELTAYFDEHEPDDGYGAEYADDQVDVLIESVIFGGASFETLARFLTRQGWFLAEGTNSAPRLTKLLYNLCTQLPRWELNGWSQVEWLDMHGIPLLIAETEFDGEDDPVFGLLAS